MEREQGVRFPNEKDTGAYPRGMILEDSEPHGPNFLSGGIKGIMRLLETLCALVIVAMSAGTLWCAVLLL